MIHLGGIRHIAAARTQAARDEGLLLKSFCRHELLTHFVRKYSRPRRTRSQAHIVYASDYCRTCRRAGTKKKPQADA